MPRQMPPLQPRITLRINRSTSNILLPIRARIDHRAANGIQPRNQTRALQELNAQPLAHMPRDVAMQQPRARIVGLERNDQPPRRRQRRDVPAHWVFEVQRAELRGGVGALT